jgi:hypothetical protein
MNIADVPNSPEWMKASSIDGMIDVLPRDYLYHLDLDFDIDSQLKAIQRLILLHRKTKENHSAEIKQSRDDIGEERGTWREYAEAHHIDLLHESVYQDAAHSMAAVGMVAPVVETIFTQCFRGIGNKWPTDTIPGTDHERWRAVRALLWDCHKFVAKGSVDDDLTKGILQLADATGLRSKLPKDIDKTLSALFGYRNKMFHCGFEWPKDERVKFQSRISSGTWPKTWFDSASIGGEPWIFYLTEKFIEHCLSTIESVLTAFGEFVRDDLIGRRSQLERPK